MQESNIGWTDYTWNPVHGCSKVSAGCDNCYAERISLKWEHTDAEWTPENAAQNVSMRPDKLDEPYKVDDAASVFVNSMSDLFHSRVTDDFIQEVFSVMRNCPHLVFQILTKRPGRAAHMQLDWPPNVWIGTSVEDKRVIDRLSLLADCDAALRFVSFEPLIGPVAGSAADLDLSAYDWVIVGGESGRGYREMAHEWVWPIHDAANRDDAAFFFKQSAAHRNETDPYLRMPDGTRREIKEFPDPHEAVEEARRNL